MELIRIHQPKVVMFVYKGVLDKILRFGFGIKEKSVYGFNPELENIIKSRVFVFPMPGTPCRKEQATVAMQELSHIVHSTQLEF